MTGAADWAPLRDELDHWATAGRCAALWLRDDDAVDPSPQLDRLLEIAGRHGAPLTLAVIPKDTGMALAHRLDDTADVTVAVHGWSHENHAPAAAKSAELGGARPALVVLSDLRAALDRLTTLHGNRTLPVLVPPWNRIDAALLPHLAGCGFAALSVFGAERAMPIRAVNCHVDLIDWKGTRGARPVHDLVADMVQRLRTMRAAAGSLGILTHHLVHDRAASDFVDTLLSVTAGHPGCAWVSLRDLLGRPAA